MANGKLSKLKEAVAKKKAEAQRKESAGKEISPAKPEIAKPAIKKPESAKSAPLEKKASMDSPEMEIAPLMGKQNMKSGPIGPANPNPEPQDSGKIELIQISPPAPSLNSLIMSDSRVSEMSDKLLVFRNVLRRYGEIEKGKRASDIVDEEVKKLLSKKKKK